MSKQRELAKCPSCAGKWFGIIGVTRSWLRRKVIVECTKCKAQFKF